VTWNPDEKAACLSALSASSLSLKHRELRRIFVNLIESQENDAAQAFPFWPQRRIGY
jgi:hypothetical protein